MLYLTTGANGAGKTLFTLKHVRELQLKESRPVAYNGRFELVSDFGWKKIDAKDWEAEPDGTIFFFDECHNDFPKRGGTTEPPRYVSQLAEHRRRGFDFFLITQHPLNIDAFVRRLIGSPGWHRHLKRASGARLASQLEWPSVNERCEKAGSGESGSVTMVPYPKEVFSWYASTSLDTAKVKIPFQVKLLAACLLVVPIAGWFAYKTFWGTYPGGKPGTAIPTAGPNAQTAATVPSTTPKATTPYEYVQSFQPRVAGLAHSAPRYDKLTEPVEAPFPSACVASRARCSCFSRQGTPLDVAPDLCRQIVAHGIFEDFDVKGGRRGASADQPPPIRGQALRAPQEASSLIGRYAESGAHRDGDGREGAALSWGRGQSEAASTLGSAQQSAAGTALYSWSGPEAVGGLHFPRPHVQRKP